MLHVLSESYIYRFKASRKGALISQLRQAKPTLCVSLLAQRYLANVDYTLDLAGAVEDPELLHSLQSAAITRRPFKNLLVLSEAVFKLHVNVIPGTDRKEIQNESEMFYPKVKVAEKKMKKYAKTRAKHDAAQTATATAPDKVLFSLSASASVCGVAFVFVFVSLSWPLSLLLSLSTISILLAMFTGQDGVGC